MTQLKDEVYTVVQELSTTRLSFTIIGRPDRGTEGSKSSVQLKSAERSKSLEDCNSCDPTRDIDDRVPEEPSISPVNDGRTEKEKGTDKHKYSSMSAEVCFTKDRPVLQKRLAKKLDVRYVNIKQKIRSSCMLSCDQKQCPAIKERMTYHKRVHHSSIKKNDNACGTRTGMRDQGITVSPTLSIMRLAKFAQPVMDDGRCVQTDITMKDFSPNNLFIKEPTRDERDMEIPLRNTETRDVVAKRNFYKEHLQNEVLDWLRNVPMFFSLNFTTRDIKDHIVCNLVVKINELATQVHDETYEMKTKLEIDDCFSKLPMWLHGTRQQQALLKDNLKERLWNRIKGLNKILLGVSYKEENVDDTVKLNALSYEKEMVDWSLNLILDPAASVTRSQVVTLLMRRLSALLEIRLHTTSYKLILKGEIIDILDNLPLTFPCQQYKTVQLNKLAEALANRLLNVQLKQGLSNPKDREIISPSVFQISSQITRRPIPRSLHNYKNIVLNKVVECLDKVPVCNRNGLKKEICSAFLDSSLSRVYRLNVKDEIIQFLSSTGKISMSKAEIVANMLIQNVNEGLNNARKSTSTSFDSVIPKFSGPISIYRWGFGSPPAASTPKKEKPQKNVPKLNPEETAYIEKVAGLITEWLDTLPKQFDEEPGFKKTVIYDLAGDIMDHQKLQKLAPDSVHDKTKYQKYLIYKWLCKFSFFEEDKLRTDSVPLVAQFQKKLNDIPVPVLTASQHGRRQEMGAIKYMHNAGAWDEDYVAKGIDVIEDQISVWVNEQPSEIITNKDKNKRNKMVHDLALNLQDHLRNKDPESDIEADINQWLKKVVNSKEREHINLLTQDLKSKVIDLPQDRTLEGRHDERHREMVAKIAAKRQQNEGQPIKQRMKDVSNLGNIQGDPDKTIREFIGKYIEHNYDIDDPMARGAFAHLLKIELRKLAPPTRKQVYEHFEQAKEHHRFRPDSLNYELEYIKAISDWLTRIPIEPSYNTVGNKARIEYINDLARNIIEIEEQRNDDPDAMDYNYLICSTILQSMNTYNLPIPSQYLSQTHMMAYQLLEKIVDLRPAEVCCPQISQESDSISASILGADIKDQNLSDFINDYIRVNGREIADDELKLEAWTARLMKEIKKMVHEGADPQTLTKAQVYEKFAEIPIPNDESVEAFSLKLQYVKEITDWMKNLPLQPLQPEQVEERIQMISELSEKMCDTQAQRRVNGNNSGDKQLEEYIAAWISQLPLDKSKEIIKPILIQQLLSRMAKDSKRDQPPKSLEMSRSASIVSSSKASKRKSTEKDSKRDSKKISMKHSPTSKSYKGKTPADEIIEAIETWSNKLPIKLDDKETVKNMKEGIARQLYQKIGELNVDPRIFNDELLYREMLDDEIETQLENVPQNSELQDNREEIKEGLINKIIGTNQVIKEKSAGDNYRHKLETTIDSSIPNPVQSVQAFDPGFEIYKNHLADMFILENFDHANDDIKAAHEKRVRHEIDKYFESAQNKNAIPLTKDQIYNEIYSALFKVPMPQENSVIDEVEQVKTRCEIDAWYEKLPIQETDNLNELLERDQILSTLAKRIQEIEKNGSEVDDKINKETRKWLEKLPLKSGQQGIDKHVKQLQSILKSTADARKYVPPEAMTKGKCKPVKQSKGKKAAKDLNTSQACSQACDAPGHKATPPRPRSSVLQSKATNAKPCCPPVGPMSCQNKKPGDLIVETVEDWCNQLPLISTEENNVAIINNVATRIIIQISELNMDSEIFNDDIVYDELLDDALDHILSNLPVCCDFEQTKAERKYQLIEQIKSIKPLIKEEMARHDYKEELNSTVASILKEPRDTLGEDLAKFNKYKEEIVEDFIQYYHDINDEEARQYYKSQIHDVVHKFCLEVSEHGGTGDRVDPLVRYNQLLCELQKIPVPQSALKQEVAEIKMKKEVEQFLREQSIPEGDAKDSMTKNLAKRLCDIEKSGHSPPNANRMKSDIIRGLTKLKKDVSPQVVDDFVNKLKHNESERNAPPETSSETSYLNGGSPGNPVTCQTGMPMQTTCRTPEVMLGNPRMPAPILNATHYSSVPMQAYPPQICTYPPTPMTSNQASNLNEGRLQDPSPGSSKPVTCQAGMPMQTTYRTPEVMLGEPGAPPMPPPMPNVQTHHSPVPPQIWGFSPNQGPPQQNLSPDQIEQGFAAGNFLRSTVKPPRTQLSSGHLTSFAGPVNLNMSLASAVPSPRLNQDVLNRSCPQTQQTSLPPPPLRRLTSGIIPTRLNFGQTPRQVTVENPPLAQTSRQATVGNSPLPPPQTPLQVRFENPPLTPNPLPLTDVTSESFFNEAPVFNPVHYSVYDPYRSRSPGADKQGVRNILGGQDPRSLARPRRPMVFKSSDDDELCICEICSYSLASGHRHRSQRIPLCLMSMDHSYSDCLGFPMNPMMYGMHFPGCMYY